jgi:hypothetical protein
MIQNYINHIVFVVDRSSSIDYNGLSDAIVKVFDTQIEYLAKRSKELDQETRVSVYLFGDDTECLIYDMDVMRLPSLKKHYRAYGNTALIDGTFKAIEDLEQTAQLYGDHAFLTYVLTDGEENKSRKTGAALARKIDSLPENWTVAVLVPNQTGVYEAKKHGFPTNNIQVWATNRGGLQEAGKNIREATDRFMQGRAKGVRGTKNLFALDTDNLTKKTVRQALDELSPREYVLLSVQRTSPIREYVEDEVGQYVVGSVYYELMKAETVQAGKQIVVRDKDSGKVYSGRNARKILGLPDYSIRVAPTDHDGYDIFVQSTSVNRKLLKHQNIIVLK